MICGSAKIRMDDRGRLALPNRFRDYVAAMKNAYLTAHPHGCLALYTGEDFERIVGQFEQMSKLPVYNSHIEEVIVGCAEEVRPDSAGRILISTALRARARIERDTLLFVMNGRMRIWAEERWEQLHQVLESKLQDNGFSEQLWRDLKI